VLSMDLGPKKCLKFDCYNWEFVITKFVITEFHCTKSWILKKRMVQF
jgi:hypothetical protein